MQARSSACGGRAPPLGRAQSSVKIRGYFPFKYEKLNCKRVVVCCKFCFYVLAMTKEVAMK